MVFPSREKYADSRKLPFIAFQDRFRRFLARGECSLILIGYSFSDEHLNDILFHGLRTNPRAAATALIYGDATDPADGGDLVVPDRIARYGAENRNLAIYGPDRACIGGLEAPWGEPSENRSGWAFWDPHAARFKLGDFRHFVVFLERFIGFEASVRAPQQSTQPAQAAKEPGQPDDHEHGGTP